MLSGPLGPLRGTCHATPRDLRRALGPVPCGAHPRPAVTELQSRRGASAARGSASPTRGSPLPCLSATQPHPDIPTIRLPWSSRSFPCLPPPPPPPARADPGSGPLGPRAPARWDAGTSRSGTSRGPRPALALLLEPSAGAAGRLRAPCPRRGQEDRATGSAAPRGSHPRLDNRDGWPARSGGAARIPGRNTPGSAGPGLASRRPPSAEPRAAGPARPHAPRSEPAPGAVPAAHPRPAGPHGGSRPCPPHILTPPRAGPRSRLRSGPGPCRDGQAPASSGTDPAAHRPALVRAHRAAGAAVGRGGHGYLEPVYQLLSAGKLPIAQVAWAHFRFPVGLLQSPDPLPPSHSWSESCKTAESMEERLPAARTVMPGAPHPSHRCPSTAQRVAYGLHAPSSAQSYPPPPCHHLGHRYVCNASHDKTL
ncbi:unnamed protein product [Rangifer tarandus platyrhynchus]|uniref:Uncharacterized protein n=2 Tax=Rangifer tarandus platyrhynchus TaxID=3082113 RepID=A0ACB0ELH8_RANTA|nr:unnamed protein product [Rangifer tarandus platyrhynchus]CAI9701535.1 unnamed protein product [Rangifer tarandus platyrhynchus]